jgi:hypothetical protein
MNISRNSRGGASLCVFSIGGDAEAGKAIIRFEWPPTSGFVAMPTDLPVQLARSGG